MNMGPDTFAVGGNMTVRRLGFGSMRLAGPGVWGPPRDRAAALETLRRVPELGINLIDTADSYGPDVTEPLIHEALFPYAAGLHIATKAGLRRPGPDQWQPHGDPDYLIAQAHRSRELLKVDRIDLWQLHRIDPAVPAGEQFAAIRHLLDTGVIRHAGLSEVSVAQIEMAQRVFPVATVQNRYNLADRASEDVLNHCEANAIGFIPWFPLAAGRLTESGSVLERIAQAHGASSGQIAIAWLLRRSAVILPIPGTSKVAHLEENAAASSIALSDAEFEELDKAGRASA
ncbi:aldo/keto reductase [Novosphingobium sp. P6W]|uniref:aldo/keto reductase n=1 Tax=Novosphingobium sp. P6W TaxID=1609758 RepID=UPI0005C2D1F3|nr:aldo/keto reductase [Novosphingobium sp. P6W]AXB80379.1 oxidoreductase [Novosphingobium sp. P6W]KIS31335.1 oxidoreductase [Novosphingobium sp. P6W]